MSQHTSIPNVHQHEPSTLIPILTNHLPLSLPLLRRIQFHLCNPIPYTYCLASFPPPSLPPSRSLPTSASTFASASKDESAESTVEGVFTILFLELHPEEEEAAATKIEGSIEPDAWLFSSLNLPSSTSTRKPPSQGHFDSEAADHKQDADERLAATQLLTLLAACHDLLSQHHSQHRSTTTTTTTITRPAPETQTQTQPQRQREGKNPPLLLHSLPTLHLSLLRTYYPSLIPSTPHPPPNPCPRTTTEIPPPSGPWTTLLFRHHLPSSGSSTSTYTHTPPNLPPDLIFSPPTTNDYPIISRTNTILASSPNPNRQLAPLPHAGIRSLKTGELVAWGFLSKQGSARTLYVTPRFRGLGLGAAVVGRLMGVEFEGAFSPKRQVGRGGVGEGDQEDGDDDESWVWGYAHSDSSNEASVGTFTGGSTKGWKAWEVWWARVDVERAWHLAHEGGECLKSSE